MWNGCVLLCCTGRRFTTQQNALRSCASVSTLDHRVSGLRLCSLNSCAYNLKVLLEHGANVDEVNNDEETPLHLVAENGHTEVAKVNLQCDLRRLGRRSFADSSGSQR